MFPPSLVVFNDDETIPYNDPDNIGNKTLYMLICAKIHKYFQSAIK